MTGDSSHDNQYKRFIKQHTGQSVTNWPCKTGSTSGYQSIYGSGHNIHGKRTVSYKTAWGRSNSDQNHGQ